MGAISHGSKVYHNDRSKKFKVVIATKDFYTISKNYGYQHELLCLALSSPIDLSERIQHDYALDGFLEQYDTSTQNELATIANYKLVNGLLRKKGRIVLTPYEAVYNQPPPIHLPYLPGESPVESVDRTMQRREAMLALLRQQLTKAQHRMKTRADKERTERMFKVGDWVWLKLQSYKQGSVQQRMSEKISPKYYGPFQVEDTVGKVAYKLTLPGTAKIHKVFHVSQLKAFRGNLPVAPHIPNWMQELSSDDIIQPADVLERTVKRQNKATVQYLVHWEGFPIHDATWKFAEVIEQQYPEFIQKIAET
ncbi:uncharacterized protein LOC141638305 [Silene latifolia]|uniref:uncharacterized protein LOC141638305 n=1 Tax=Silene latifolia TaxID=37657 RepID=UPI003D776C2B